MSITLGRGGPQSQGKVLSENRLLQFLANNRSNMQENQSNAKTFIQGGRGQYSLLELTTP